MRQSGELVKRYSSGLLPRRLLFSYVLGLVLLISGVANVHAFTANSQNASLVLGQADFTSSTSATTSTSLNAPFGGAFDSSGNLWVSEQGNNRVLKFAPPFSTGEAATLVLGQSDFVSGGSATTSTGLSYPIDVAFDSAGNLWVSDKDNNRILRYLAPLSTGEAATLVLGQSDFVSGGSATTSTGLSHPASLAFDSSGNLWVSDNSNNRVLEFTTPFSTGESASLVIGQTDFTSGGAATTSTGLRNPNGLAFDSSGNLWVSDQFNHRVLKYPAPFSTHESASLVIGQTDFTSGGFATTSTALFAPCDLAFDSSGNLWVCDSANQRILMYPAPFSTHEAASLVIGQTDFLSRAIATTSAGLKYPNGVAFDSSGNLWVSDAGNRRVLEYQSLASATQALAPAVVGFTVPTQTFATTGMTVGATGLGSGTTASIYTADLSSQPPGTGSTGLSSPSFFDVGISGITGGTATVCIDDASATASTIMVYWTGSVWATASSIVVTPGVKVCGDIPVSALVGTTISLGPLLSVPEFPVAYSLPFVFAAGAMIYVLLRSRLPTGGLPSRELRPNE